MLPEDHPKRVLMLLGRAMEAVEQGRSEEAATGVLRELMEDEDRALYMVRSFCLEPGEAVTMGGSEPFCVDPDVDQVTMTL